MLQENLDGKECSCSFEIPWKSTRAKLSQKWCEISQKAQTLRVGWNYFQRQFRFPRRNGGAFPKCFPWALCPEGLSFLFCLWGKILQFFSCCLLWEAWHIFREGGKSGECWFMAMPRRGDGTQRWVPGPKVFLRYKSYEEMKEKICRKLAQKQNWSPENGSPWTSAERDIFSHVCKRVPLSSALLAMHKYSWLPFPLGSIQSDTMELRPSSLCLQN